jgi:hypothetical protein
VIRPPILIEDGYNFKRPEIKPTKEMVRYRLRIRNQREIQEQEKLELSQLFESRDYSVDRAVKDSKRNRAIAYDNVVHNRRGNNRYQTEESPDSSPSYSHQLQQTSNLLSKVEKDARKYIIRSQKYLKQRGGLANKL